MNITSITNSAYSYFYPTKVEKAPVEVAVQTAPAEVEQAPVATASQSSKLLENGARALLIGTAGLAMCAITLAAGNGQAWEQMADKVAGAFMGLTAACVVSQGKDVVDVVVDSSVAGVKTGVSCVAGGLGYVSNITGATWVATTIWNKTYDNVAKPGYDFAASLNPYAKKV